MLKRLILMSVTCALAGLISVSAMAADAAPDDIIKYRKNVMSAIGAKTNAIAAILKGEVDQKGSLAAHAEALAAASNAALVNGAFQQNTDGQGNEKTTATAKIWSDWARFEKASVAMEAATAEVSKLAAAGELTSMDQLRPVFAQCGECHKDAGFRD